MPKADGAAAKVEANGHRNGRTGAADEREGVQGLLELLVDRARRPLDEAQALPGEWFTSPAIYELEMERIFKRDWLYVGRASEIPNPGDWISVRIGDEPIVVVRDRDMEIRGMSRVCPHRFMDLLARDDKDAEGATCDHGNVEGFVCPYHAWSFNLDGSMAGAPLMNSSRLFARESYRMEQFKTETWNGFVFLSLDADAPPLAPRLADVAPLVERYDLDNWVHMDRMDWPEAPANWKLAMDNGRECYHHLGAHKDSVEPLWPSHLVDPDTTESRHWYAQRMFVSPEASTGTDDGHLVQPLVLPPLEGLTAYDRSHYLLIGIYPSMFFACGPDLLLTGKWLPTGIASNKFEIGLSVHRSQLDNPDLDRIVTESVEWLYSIQAEDAGMLTGIQPQLRSRVAQRGGPLCYLERPVWQFHKYLAERLADTVV